MKAAIFTTLAVAGIAHAQLDGIPTCAVSCIGKVLPEIGCENGADFECACKNMEDLMEADCFKEECEGDDLDDAKSQAEKLCANLVGDETSSETTIVETNIETSTMTSTASEDDAEATTTVAETTVTSPTPTPSGSVTTTKTEGTKPTNGGGAGGDSDDGDDSDNNGGDSDSGSGSGSGENGEGEGEGEGEGGDGDSAGSKPIAGLAAAAVALLAAL